MLKIQGLNLDDSILFHQKMQGVSMVDGVGWSKGNLIPYLYNGSTYNNLYSDKTFSGPWCEGEPNNEDETCITCDTHCCSDTNCIVEQSSYYQLIPGTILYLRYILVPYTYFSMKGCNTADFIKKKYFPCTLSLTSFIVHSISENPGS